MDTSILSFLALAAVVLGGVGAILGGVSIVLHAVAQRTKSPVVERIAVADDAAHAKLDQALSLLRAVAPAPSSTVKVGPVAVLALVVLGVAGAGSLTACAAGSTARQDAAAGLVAALDCEAGSLDPATLADARLFAGARVQGWIAGTAPADLATLRTKILADIAPVKTNLGRCAVAGALASALAIAAPAPGAAVQGLALAPAGPPPDQVRAAFSVTARAFGWPPVKVAGGAVF